MKCENKYTTSDEWALKKIHFQLFFFAFYFFRIPSSLYSNNLAFAFLVLTRISYFTSHKNILNTVVCVLRYVFPFFLIRSVSNFVVLPQNEKARDQNLLFHLLALKRVTKVTKKISEQDSEEHTKKTQHVLRIEHENCGDTVEVTKVIYQHQVEQWNHIFQYISTLTPPKTESQMI